MPRWHRALCSSAWELKAAPLASGSLEKTKLTAVGSTDPVLVSQHLVLLFDIATYPRANHLAYRKWAGAIWPISGPPC